MNDLIGFIGCGNMGGALAQAICRSVRSDRILLCDQSEDKATALAEKTDAKAVTSEELIKNCKYIFLGVKPQGFPALFDEIGETLRNRKDTFVLITMAAGIEIAKVTALLKKECPVIRIMPNTPVAVGEGMILYTANKLVKNSDIEEFCNFMRLAGRTDRLPEEKTDAAGALSGCGPAFVYLFAEALADGAVECGLPRDKASLYAAQTLYGAAKLLLESGKHPGELKDAVCSPGGTTIAGVHSLESGSFRASTMDAVVSAYKKTIELK